MGPRTRFALLVGALFSVEVVLLALRPTDRADDAWDAQKDASLAAGGAAFSIALAAGLRTRRARSEARA